MQTLAGYITIHVYLCIEPTQDFGTYRICEQRRLRRDCASAQSRQSLLCSHTWSKNQTSSNTRWLSMRIWRMHLRRTKSTIISCQDSIREITPEPSLFAHMYYRTRRRFRPRISHLEPLSGCTCAFEECHYGRRKVPLSRVTAHMSSGCWTMKRCTFLMSKGFSPVWIRTPPPPPKRALT